MSVTPACANQPEYKILKLHAEPGARGEGGRILVTPDELVQAMLESKRGDVSADALECIREGDEMRIEPGLLRRLFDQPWVDARRYGILSDMVAGRWGGQPPPSPPPPKPPPAPPPSSPAPPPAAATTAPVPSTGTSALTVNGSVTMNEDANLRESDRPIGMRAFRGGPGLTMGLAELSLNYAPGSDIQLHADVIAGVDEKVLNASGLGGQGVGLWQVYAQSGPDDGFHLRAGRFATWLGAEVAESIKNPNLSQSFLFAKAIPFSHFGVTTGRGDGHGNGYDAGVINGSDIQDSQHLVPAATIRAFGVPADNLAASVQSVLGPERVGKDVNMRVIVDSVVDCQITPSHRLLFNFDWGSEERIISESWTGAALVYEGKFGPWRIAPRAEFFYDTGTRNDLSVSHVLFGEGTLTVGRTLGDHWLARGEYRHDLANQAAFPGAKGGMTDSQDTVALALSFQF